MTVIETADPSIVERCADLDRRIAEARGKATELRQQGEQAHADPTNCKDWNRVAGWRERAEAIEAQAARLEGERRELEAERSAGVLAELLGDNTALGAKMTAIVEELALELAPALSAARQAADLRAAELQGDLHRISMRRGELARDDARDLGAELINQRQIIGQLWSYVSIRAAQLADDATTALTAVEQPATEEETRPNAD